MPEVVGYVFEESGYYRPDSFDVVLREGVSVEPGEFLWIDVDGTRVYYQVVEVVVRRRPTAYDEIMLKTGRAVRDEESDFPRARVEQVGYVSGRRLDSYTGLVRPHQEIYRAGEEDLEVLLSWRRAESAGPTVLLGGVRPGGLELRLRAWDLMRRGLVVFGGVGSGKTTTLLNVVVRLIEAVRSAGGTPSALVLDKDGEYGPVLSERLGAEVLDASSLIHEGGGEDVYSVLRSALGLSGQSREAKALKAAVISSLGGVQGAVTRQTVEAVIQRLETLAAGGGQTGVQREAAASAASQLRSILDNFPEAREGTPASSIPSLVEGRILVLDLTRVEDWDDTYMALSEALTACYKRALADRSFGLLVVIDEAHLFAPERGGVSLAEEQATRELRSTLKIIATTGPRNGITPFISTQRPALVDKTLTTQLGQNVISHRVEDVDLDRVKEMIGSIAEAVRLFPEGRAIVKSTAAPLPRPVIVDVVAETFPASTGWTALDRWVQGGSAG